MALLPPLMNGYARIYLIVNGSLWNGQLSTLWSLLNNAFRGSLRLLVHTKSFHETTPVIYCDQCNRSITTYWHCNMCHGGDYDICQQCKSAGLWCKELSHDLAHFDPSWDQMIVDVDSLFIPDRSSRSLAQVYTSKMIDLHQHHPLDSDQWPILTDTTYEEIITQNIMNSHNEHMAMAALAVVSHTCWPLKDHVFQHALESILKDQHSQSAALPKLAGALEATGGLLIVHDSVVGCFEPSLIDYLGRTRHRWFPSGYADMAEACLAVLSSQELPLELDLLWQNSSFYGHAACAWGHYLRKCPGDSIVEYLALSHLRDGQRLRASTLTAFHLQPSEMAYGFDIGQGLEAIHTCSIFGLPNLIQRLSPTTFDLDRQTPVHKRTPLSYACSMNQDDTVEVLLKLGADPNLRYDGGPTVLQEAIGSKYLPVVRSLLRSPALLLRSLTTRDSEQVHVLLSITQLQTIDILKLALDRHDVDVNERDHNGRSVLWWLLSTSYHEKAPAFQLSAVKLILEHPRCDVNGVGLGGRNYIMRFLVARSLSSQLLDILLDHGVDVEHRDERGESAIFYAVTLPHETRNTSRLIRKGADLMIRNSRGQGLLHRLLSDVEDSRGLPYIELLLSRTPTLIDFPDERGRTPLHLALFLGKTHVAEELLNKQPNIGLSDNYGRTPFDVACQYGRTALLRRLKPPTRISGHGNSIQVSMEATGDEEQLDILPAWSLCLLGICPSSTSINRVG